MAGPSWIAGKVWGACLFASAFISLNHKLRGIKGLASKDIGNGVCLRGWLVWEFYDELERICTETVELRPGGPVVALNVPAG